MSLYESVDRPLTTALNELLHKCAGNIPDREAVLRHTSADESLANLRKALLSVKKPVISHRVQNYPTPSTLASSPTQPPPLTQEDSKPPSLPLRNSQTIRSERKKTLTISFTIPAVKTLQDGLLQLKEAIASRRGRNNHTRSNLTTPSDPFIRTRPQSLILPAATPTECGRDAPIFPFDDDILSQADSAGPSNVLQSYILNALQGVTQRLKKLENSQQTAPPATNVLDTLDDASLASLQAELAQERFQRIKLEALVSALGSRLGLDIEAAGLIIPAGDENPTVLNSMAHSELRAMVQVLTSRTKEAVRGQVVAKCKSVQLNAALKTVSDLSTKIVDLEERTLKIQQPVDAMNCISNMSLKIQSQNVQIKAMTRELTTYKSALADSHFKLMGYDHESLLEALRLCFVDSTGQMRDTSNRQTSTESTPGISTPSPCGGNKIKTIAAEQSPRNDYVEELDRALQSFYLQENPKLRFIKMENGYYKYGSQVVKVGLSSRSRSILVFFHKKKYSLMKFIELYENAEYTHDRQPWNGASPSVAEIHRGQIDPTVDQMAKNLGRSNSRSMMKGLGTVISRPFPPTPSVQDPGCSSTAAMQSCGPRVPSSNLNLDRCQLPTPMSENVPPFPQPPLRHRGYDEQKYFGSLHQSGGVHSSNNRGHLGNDILHRSSAGFYQSSGAVHQSLPFHHSTHPKGFQSPSSGNSHMQTRVPRLENDNEYGRQNSHIAQQRMTYQHNRP